MKELCGVLALVNRKSEYYGDYERYIRPYLLHFGFPLEEADVNDGPDLAGFPEYSLILAGHRMLLPKGEGRSFFKAIGDAVEKGTGFVSFDPWVFEWTEACPGLVSKQGASLKASSLRIVDNSHYITEKHGQGESIELLSDVFVEYSSMLKDGVVLIRAGKAALLEAGLYGRGRLVKWNDMSWMSHRVRGPVFGMDDLLWRGMVWAARKPAVMLGMPPMVTMRVDDVWGSERSRHENPLYWLDVCVRYGLKPWLGIFLYNLSPRAVGILREHMKTGAVTVFPHAFSGNERQIDNSPFVEDWIYFDHRNFKSYSDEVLKLNMLKTKRWLDINRIWPLSRVAIPHYYEMGANAIPYLLEWGCEFTGVHMPPGVPYFAPGGDKGWLKGGPFRLYEDGGRDVSRPVYYADYLKVEGFPEYDGKLFNCVAEIRDIKGYEWAPDNNVEGSVAAGVKQLKRSFDSMVLATLFTHESDYIQNISPENWERIIEGIAGEIGSLNPICVTYDYACAYVRARNGIRLLKAVCQGGSVSLNLEGQSGMEVMCYVFTEDSKGRICSRLYPIPAVDGKAKAEIKLD